MSDLVQSILAQHMSTGIVPNEIVDSNNMSAPCGGGKCSNNCKTGRCSTPGGKCGGKCQSKCRK